MATRLTRSVGHCVQPLEQAAAFYRGDFMAGFSLRDSAAFDEWQFFQSEKLKNELAGALRRLALAYSSQVETNRAIQTARRWLTLDLLNEEAHRLLMQIRNRGPAECRTAPIPGMPADSEG